MKKASRVTPLISFIFFFFKTAFIVLCLCACLFDCVSFLYPAIAEAFLREE